MKFIYIIIAACLVLQVSCTRTKEDQTMNGKNQVLSMDSLYQNDKQVTVVQKNENVLLSEEMKNFEDNPNISQADLDAINRVEAKGIKYVQKGDKVILSEKE